VNDRHRPGGSHRRGNFTPLIMVLFNEHSFAVHALKNARLHLIRFDSSPEPPADSADGQREKLSAPKSASRSRLEHARERHER
jgi:hypothetical protein